ncbi:MAG TPA: isocitrate lyase/phosphoenolpyruvate mutase family protein [Phycisphaerales bacterium]|nr:isocitrate lyase/phosphoenolpyruvate mutase family protein [Phycisphaerales bacterium]
MSEPVPCATPAQRLRDLVKARGCVAAPGAFSALCARAIARAGFGACYVSGAATSVSAGVPDVGLLTLEHLARVVREAGDAAGLPVIADADTGFGEAEMVRRTVIEYARAGAAALHIEDQVFPKRCGHLDGKTLIPTEHMVEKVRWAARAARDQAPAPAEPPAPIIVGARTDARGVEGLQAALDRAKAYAEAGAELLFPEGLTSPDEFARFARELSASAPHVLLLANMTEFGKTPLIPLASFAQMGYHVVIFPVSLLRVAMGAVTRALETLAADGSVAAFLDQMQTRAELYDLIGYTPGQPWAWPAGPGGHPAPAGGDRRREPGAGPGVPSAGPRG